MTKQKHTRGKIDVFVGNADGRGLIRLEVHGTGQHVASMPRGKQSEINAMRLSLCWNMHDEMAKVLRSLLFCLASPVAAPFAALIQPSRDKALAIIAKLDAQ